MRVLVAGGAGFIGSHLCDKLIADDHEVVCVDNLCTGRASNIRHLSGRDTFTFIEADIADDLEVPGPLHAVINLASPASPPDYQRMPLETLRVGSAGTQTLLDIALKKNARFVLASTSEVYGDPRVHPQTEEYWGNVNPVGPRSVYDEAKRYAEAVTAAYARSRGLNTGIVRIFNTYGPRMRAADGRVVSTFISQSLTGQALTVYGDGSQTRSFCYVSDLVEGLMKMIDSAVPGPVNLGNPSEHTVFELAAHVVAATDSTLEVRHLDLPEDDPVKRKPDITTARTHLGWSPKVSLDEGLVETVAWFRSQPDEVGEAVHVQGVGLQPEHQRPRYPVAVRESGMRITVIGTGYLGAVHAAGMASLGHEVLGVDTDHEKIASLESGHSPFFEPDFDDLLMAGRHTGRLHFTTSFDEAAAFGRAHFLCVGTPQQGNSGHADLSYLENATEELIARSRDDCLVVGKSTVPVGTAAHLRHLIENAKPKGLDIRLAWNPEFLREGFAVVDTLHPDRIVFGVDDDSSEGLLREIFEPIIARGTPAIVTDLATSQLIKVAANSFLAMKISFINLMAEICDRTDADVVTLADALGRDERIGRRFLDAGLGFGGGCLTKDIRAFSARSEELGVDGIVDLLAVVDHTNLRRREHVVERAVELLGGAADDRRVTVLGAAFKPKTDDVRNSPALYVARRLAELGALVRVHDPRALDNAALLAPELDYAREVDKAVEDADIILHLTEWQDYRQLDPEHLCALVHRPVLLDARNSLDLRAWSGAGWSVHGIGRTSAPPLTRPVHVA